MRGPVLIAGAGAIGSVVGGLLAAAGSTVTLLGRRDHMDAVQARGLAIDGLFGTHRVSGLECATAAAELGGPYRAIFLTVKAYDAAEMLDTVAPFLDRDGVLVCMQNGLGTLEPAVAAVGQARVLGARVIFGAELPEPGRATVTVCADPVLIGALEPAADGQRARAVAWASALADAGIPA
ncbi:MAG TPA: 2-dehydropantoate 2-reductase, partial [Solirubrobacteraceae bacterium]